MPKAQAKERGFIQLLLVVLLLVGIGVGVYLVQFTQIFKPKAAEPNTTQPYGSTPLSDVSLYPKPANGIQTMVYFIFAASTLANDKPYLNYLASTINYVWFDQSSLANCPTAASCTFENFTSVTNQLRSINPNIKVGVHAGAAGGAAPYHMIYPYLSDTDFLHKTDGSVQKMSDPRVSSINLSTSTTRQKIADGWKQIFTANPALTGINFDAYSAYNGMYPQGCREGDCNSEAFWIPAIFDLSTRTATANPGKDITYNGLFYQSNTSYGGEMNSTPIAYHNGVLVEWPHEMLVNSTIFRKYLDVISRLTGQGKKIFYWVQPEIFHHSYGNNFLETNQIPVDLNLERFYLASYLLFQKNPLTYFGYSPNTVYDGNKGLLFYKDWNMDYGDPVGEWSVTSTGLYTRTYSNGVVVVNPYAPGEGNAAGSRVFTFPANVTFREWDPTGTVMASSVTIPARSGKFYFQTKPLQAKYELVTPPAEWLVGKPQQIQVKVTNNGTETWLKKDQATANGRFDLAAYFGPDDDWSHGTLQALGMLPADVPPGGSQTVTVTIGTPQTTGSQTLRLRMVKQGFAWFDPVFKSQVNVVTTISPSPSPALNLAPLTCTAKPNLLKPAEMTTQGMVVNLSGGTNSEVIANQIYQINFTNFTNGTVTINGTVFTQNGTYTPSSGTNNIQLLIKQVTYGQATNIGLNVVDRCGPFSTFLGGGTGSNWPNPNPSPSLSPSPTASPTDNYKIGDINFDGKVDIFDFNSLITDFGKKNDSVTKADLDNDDDVDIFDFNLLIGNFGR